MGEGPFSTFLLDMQFPQFMFKVLDDNIQYMITLSFYSNHIKGNLIRCYSSLSNKMFAYSLKHTAKNMQIDSISTHQNCIHKGSLTQNYMVIDKKKQNEK